MTQYLISSMEMPFTASDIRAELGLLDPRFDAVIASAIAKIVVDTETRRGVCLRRQTWAVQRINGQPLEMFFRSVRSIGRHAKIGTGYAMSLNAGDRRGPFHGCAYEPDPKHFRAAKIAVVNWCWDDVYISRTIVAERRGQFRTVWPTRSARVAKSVKTPVAVAQDEVA